jgi:hypothetical protein
MKIRELKFDFPTYTEDQYKLHVALVEDYEKKAGVK